MAREYMNLCVFVYAYINVSILYFSTRLYLYSQVIAQSNINAYVYVKDYVLLNVHCHHVSSATKNISACRNI